MAFATALRSNEASARNGGHSSKVLIRLELEGGVVTVAQLGPDFILAESPQDHPAGEGTLRLQVDGAERCWRVRVPAGVRAGWARTTVALARE